MTCIVYILCCSSHLQVSLSDPSIGDKFSVEKLGSSGRRLVSVPSAVHGAPETAEVSDTNMYSKGKTLFTFFLRASSYELTPQQGLLRWNSNWRTFCRRAERLCSDFNVWQALSLRTLIPRYDGKFVQLPHAVLSKLCLALQHLLTHVINCLGSRTFCCLSMHILFLCIQLQTSKSSTTGRAGVLPWVNNCELQAAYVLGQARSVSTQASPAGQ